MHIHRRHWGLRWGMLGLILACVLASGCQPSSHTSGSFSSRMLQAQAMMDQARVYQASGLPNSALAAFGLAIENNPKLVEAYMGMGSIYMDRSQYRHASDTYRTAAKLRPNQYEPHYRLGLSYHLGGKLDNAVSAYLRALVIDPQQYDANQHLGGVLIQLGRSAQAVAYAKRATELDKHSQGAFANLAAAYSLLRQYDKAIDAYRQANELGPVHTPMLLGYGQALVKQGKYTQAMLIFEDLNKRQANPTAHERIGYCLWKQRRYVQALARYDAALALASKDIASLNGKGACHMTMYLQAGQADQSQRRQALMAWRQSVRQNPGQPRIVDLISRFQTR